MEINYFLSELLTTCFTTDNISIVPHGPEYVAQKKNKSQNILILQRNRDIFTTDVMYYQHAVVVNKSKTAKILGKRGRDKANETQTVNTCRILILKTDAAPRPAVEVTYGWREVIGIKEIRAVTGKHDDTEDGYHKKLCWLSFVTLSVYGDKQQFENGC